MNGKKVILGLGPFGALVVAALYLGLNPGNLAALAVGGIVSTWSHRKRRKRDSAFWSIVWQLRQASGTERARMLADLEPAKLRTRVAAVLDQDGTDDAAGGVEQFPFPRGLRRLAARAYWTAWGLAFTMLIVAAAVPAPLWFRCLPIVVASNAALRGVVGRASGTLIRLGYRDHTISSE